MATITGHYNVTVESRYYAFLQDDMESAEPHVLMATVERKRELRKESKTKAKKEKRNKQIAEASKENVKVETNVEDTTKVEPQIIENKEEPIDKPIESFDSIAEDKSLETKSEKPYRGRGNIRRQNGGPRRGAFPRNDERIHNDDANHQKYPDNGNTRFAPNSRGSSFRKERSESDNYNKVGYFEDQSGSNNRGNPSRRRSAGRPGSGYSRGNDRNFNDRNLNDRNLNEKNNSDRFTNDRNSNDRYNNDRNLNDRSGNDRNMCERSGIDRHMNDRNVNDDNSKTDIIPENMGTFEDMSSRPPRSSRGRYPRSNNRGGYNRFSAPPQDGEHDFENNKIGYFEENTENREYRGGRGRSSRGRRNMRRGGRGDFTRARGNDREENPDEGSFTANFKYDNQDVPIVEKWPDVEEELGGVEGNPTVNVEHEIPPNANIGETDFNDVKKSNWGEIEDDPVELKTTNEHMTLEEWRALHGKDRLLNQESKENRKANDGQDVFSGMEEYRKGRVIEEQGDEHDVHESQHGRQKQSIPVAIRFSRNTEYGDSNNFEQINTDSRNFSRGGYYKNENKFRGDNSSGGRGRSSRGGSGGGGGNSDFNTYGRGRDFNRGRGRFNRSSYPVKRKEDQIDGININLGNEDEFPTLS